MGERGGRTGEQAVCSGGPALAAHGGAPNPKFLTLIHRFKPSVGLSTSTVLKFSPISPAQVCQVRSSSRHLNCLKVFPLYRPLRSVRSVRSLHLQASNFFSPPSPPFRPPPAFSRSLTHNSGLPALGRVGPCASKSLKAFFFSATLLLLSPLITLYYISGVPALGRGPRHLVRSAAGLGGAGGARDLPAVLAGGGHELGGE